MERGCLTITYGSFTDSLMSYFKNRFSNQWDADNNNIVIYDSPKLIVKEINGVMMEAKCLFRNNWYKLNEYHLSIFLSSHTIYNNQSSIAELVKDCEVIN